jgi:hypothetical protein
VRVIKTDGTSVILQFAATKAVSEYVLRRHFNGDLEDAAQQLEADTRSKFSSCLDDNFENGHYGWNKAYYGSYDFYYGPSEFDDTDSRWKHGAIYRFVWHPVKEHFRVWKYNWKMGRKAAYEKNGKFWFPYLHLEAVLQ